MTLPPPLQTAITLTTQGWHHLGILKILAPRLPGLFLAIFRVGTSICRCTAFSWTTMEYDVLDMLVKKKSILHTNIGQG